MAAKLEYENYPVSENEMGKRYKNWMESLATYVAVTYNVGKEIGGQKYVDRVKEEFRKMGQLGANYWMTKSDSKKEDFVDCTDIAKIQDCIDDSFANFWDGYIENTPNAFEKEIKTCPLVKQLSKAPDLCEMMLCESMTSMYESINPKYRVKGFSKLLTKGDKTCRLRVEMKE